MFTEGARLLFAVQMGGIVGCLCEKYIVALVFFLKHVEFCTADLIMHVHACTLAGSQSFSLGTTVIFI